MILLHTPKQLPCNKTNSKRSNFQAVFLIFLFILFPVHYGNAGTESDNKQLMLELQAKLDELNASIAEFTRKNNKQGLSEIPAVDNAKPNNDKTNKNEFKNELAQAATGDKENKNADKKITPTEKQDNGSDKVQNEDYEKEKKKTEKIIKIIDNGTHKERKQAINQILTIKDKTLSKELEKKIIEIIRDEVELEVKIKAITVAGEMKFTETVPYLINALNDESNDVNVAAVYAIKKIGDMSAKPALINKLQEQKLDNASTLTEALINTLGELKTVELMNFAVNAIQDIKTNQIIRELLVLFLGKIGSKDSKDILMNLLKDEDENEQIRAFAANSLANLNITESAVEINKVVKEIESYPFNKRKKLYNVYIYCLAALAKLGDDNALPGIINALRSDNAVIRLKAVELIKEINDERTIDILKYKKEYDPSPKVQSAAKKALVELGVESEDKESSTEKEQETQGADSDTNAE